LLAFLKYSGLGNATIPDSNVFGDLPDDQSQPGGEAQLDVEYIMVSGLSSFTKGTPETALHCLMLLVQIVGHRRFSFIA